jgi:adenylate cyclase
MEPYNEQNRVWEGEEVQRQLQMIIDSPEFQATDRQREFLQFVVVETLAGRDKEIKGYTIATQVFGRKEDFVQATDPIVSIQAGQLRRALERYYLTAGKHDPIRIDIPKGTYVPAFHRQTETGLGNAYRNGAASEVPLEDVWPTVLIEPFQNLTGDPEKNYVGVGLATELGAEIARFQEIRLVIRKPNGHDKVAADQVARFVIDGNFRQDRKGLKITVRLVDAKTNTQIWADTHRSNLEAAQLIAFQEEVAGVVAAKTAGEHGIISKTLSIESKKKPPSDLSTYEAILRFYEYEQTLTPESFSRAMEALKLAASIEPDCGQGWTLLARLYANIYSLDFPGFENPLEKSIEFAEKGARIDPNNQRSVATLALVRFFNNELSAAIAESDRALALNPNSLVTTEGIGYIISLSGEWERGLALIRRVIKFNPYYRNVVHYALWADCFRREDYEGAYLETINLRRPAVFWHPLAKAATLGLLGRYEEGKKYAENLFKLKPDFPSRGRILIGYYIKFEDIVERVIDGLEKAGVVCDWDKDRIIHKLLFH